MSRIAEDDPLYDRIGGTYHARRPDPRFAALIDDALGTARTVVNVGAGTGAYEPLRRSVLAVEPSATMIAQRPADAAPVLQASAEALPFADDSFDAALAVNTLHHWTDVRAGLRELRRVARTRVVIFLRDPRGGEPFWLVEDYLPGLDQSEQMSRIMQVAREVLEPLRVIPVPVPHDCLDDLLCAFWARPEAYLESDRQRNISHFALAPQDEVCEGLARLRADLESGAWDRLHGDLRSRSHLDLGLRLLASDLDA